MTESLPPVARSVYLDCKKCATERYFKVITHTSTTTAKVKCEVCGSQKSYSVAEKKSTSASPKKPRVTKAAAAAEKSATAWMSLKEKRGESKAKAYTVATVFTMDESLVHPKFGLGFVTKAHPSKIEVLFAEGVKELIHGRA